MNSQQVTVIRLNNHTEAQTLSEKQAIASRFSRAAFTYNDVADIQAQIAADARETLLVNLNDTARGVEDTHHTWNIDPARDSVRVLDIGCGTGRETAALAEEVGQVTGLDIAPAMLEKARKDHPSIMFCEGDADAMSFEAGQFNAVFSSMALQWSASPQQAMAEIARVLQPGGRAQLAIMVAGSFYELSQARSEAGISASVNSLPSALLWEKAVCLAGLKTLQSAVQTYTDCFADIRSLLRSITKVGAGLSLNASANLSMTRAQLQALDRALIRNTGGQRSLSYHVLHLSLEK